MAGIAADFVLEGLQTGETALAPEEMPQLQGDGLAVQVAGIVQKPGLNGEAMAVYGGAGSDVGDGQIRSLRSACPAGIDALGGEEKLRRELQIGGGNAPGPAQMGPRYHGAGELVGMPQKPAGPVQVAGFQKGADVGGGDGDALQAVLRNDGAANPQLGAGLQQPGGGAFPPCAEAKIMAADEAGDASGPGQTRSVPCMDRHPDILS